MPVATSQILKYVDFTKTQKSRHLENEKNSFVAEVTFNGKLHFLCSVEFSGDLLLSLMSNQSTLTVFLPFAVRKSI